MIVATPSGITLAGEGGAHQSIAEPLIGLAQDGLASFEPAYVDELAAIMDWAFSYMQKDGDTAPSDRTWLRDETGGSIYLRLSTRPIDQIKREMTPELRQQIVDGGGLIFINPGSLAQSHSFKALMTKRIRSENRPAALGTGGAHRDY